ncbi:hypothetical protein [Arthrobacter hankyongi]|uniref:hypothetical protein n=1 Tax=Arthrobacter hankyongi TaxID=2904801 RepID=UPI003558B10F
MQWSRRFKDNQERLRTGDIFVIAGLVRTSRAGCGPRAPCRMPRRTCSSTRAGRRHPDRPFPGRGPGRGGGPGPDRGVRGHLD